MIVLWGVMEDTPLAAVHERLQRRGAPVTLINQRQVADCRFESVLADERLEGTVSWPGGRLDLSVATAIYARPYDISHLPQFQGDRGLSEAFARAVGFEDGMLLWCELADALVVNRPSAMASNSSKPYQSLLIRNSQFLVPETLITSDPGRVTDFLKVHGQLIYKSISSRRSIVSKLEGDDMDRLAEVAACPTQFQAFVSGVDFRVHVLGEQVFAHRIVSDASDYRYGGETVIQPADLPTDVAERCISLTRDLGLEFAGVDLRETPDGRWFCFEVNPSPGYTYFDSATGEISDALATYLLAGSRP